MRVLRVSIAAALCSVLTVACGDQQNPTAPLGDDPSLIPQFHARGPVLHHVSVGGPDICESTGGPTGCDANFSLVAHQNADGSVSGQWQDTFRPEGKVHVAVDCLSIDGNFAEVGGVITHGTVYGEDATGLRAVTAVVDNGTSANDPADQISFSITPFVTPPGFPFNCTLGRDFYEALNVLWDLEHGQVVVR